MSEEVRNKGNKPAVFEDIDNIRQCENKLLYRNPDHGISSDSADSSLKNSFSKDLDQMPNVLYSGRSSHHPAHDDIVEQLSKLKVGEKENFRGTDVGLENCCFRGHSILARNTPSDSIYHRTVHSLAESTSSVILAGGFNEKEDIETIDSEPSLLNIAINESNESNVDTAVPRSDGGEESDPDQSRNVESFHYADSLELERKRRSNVVEKDSLDNEACYASHNAAGETWMENVEQGNFASEYGAINKQKSMRKPIVISNQKVDLDIKMLRAPDNKRLLVLNEEKNVVFKDKNDNIERDLDNSDARGEMIFVSLVNESEFLATKNIKTPNLRSIRFIEDCCKSTPSAGMMADTFGSEVVSDIMTLSMLDGENENPKAEQSLLNNQETSRCRDNILKKFSQQFVEAPTEFTARLLAILEESVLHTKPGNNNTSGVSLRRLTEEFRKICRKPEKPIEDESMPDLGFSRVSTLPADDSLTRNEGEEESMNLPAQNFTSFGGAKKVYRKTPRRILKTCNSPNCANIFHRIENLGSDSTRYFEASGNLDNTETFEFWEKLCYEMSPMKQPRHNSPRKNSFEVLHHQDLIRKSDRQMAALDHTYMSPSKLGGKEELKSGEKNSTKTWKGLRDGDDSAFLATRNNNSNKTLEDVNSTETRNEIERILAARLVEKRRKCFEEASRVNKASEASIQNESSKNAACQAIFISTLSACVDYFDDINRLKDHRHSLQCIIECSEESAISETETTTDGKSLKCVEAMIMPVRNSGKHQMQYKELSNPVNNKSIKIAEAHLDLSGTSETSTMFEGQLENLEESYQQSSSHRLLSGTYSPSFVSKKIKRSVSPKMRRSLKGMKLENYLNVSQSPGIRGSKGEENISEKNQEIAAGLSEGKSSPRFPSKSKSAANSPGLMDITNIQRSNNQIPKVVISSATPSKCDSTKKSNRREIFDENTEGDCKMALEFSATETPEQRDKKYFYTPGKTPALAKVKPKKKYFGTPRQTPAATPSTPGSHRFNYNTVLSPVGMYIRGTNPNLITNVRAKTNERMLTPRSKTPVSKSKAVSPILARSPRLSPKQTETSRLKFKLSTPRKKAVQQASDILNVALCESDPSSSKGTESVSTSPFPKIFYKPAPCVKMVNDPPKQRYGSPKTLGKAIQEKIIYRHEGRLNSARRMEEQHNKRRGDDDGTKNSLTSVSGDVSLWHKKSATKTNHLSKK